MRNRAPRPLSPVSAPGARSNSVQVPAGERPRANADHVRALGRVALGSRLRRLSERLMSDVARVYKAQGEDFNPTWFPLFSLIGASSDEDRGITVVEAAHQLALTHPAVSQFAKELITAGLIDARADADDARRRTLHLTARGRATRQRLQALWDSVAAAVQGFLAEAGVDLVGDITRVEDVLDRKSSEARILLELRSRQARAPGGEQVAQAVRSGPRTQIVGYHPRFRRDFARLNLQWIRRYFWIEPDDQRVLSDPKRHILSAGGEILFALLDGRVVGTCALRRPSATTFELAKMAVDEKVQGRGIGAALLTAAIARAKESDANEVVLETHSSLQAAIHLYSKFGFRRVALPPDIAHERTDMMMRLALTRSPSRGQ